MRHKGKKKKRYNEIVDIRIRVRKKKKIRGM